MDTTERRKVNSRDFTSLHKPFLSTLNPFFLSGLNKPTTSQLEKKNQLCFLFAAARKKSRVRKEKCASPGNISKSCRGGNAPTRGEACLIHIVAALIRYPYLGCSRIADLEGQSDPSEGASAGRSERFWTLWKEGKSIAMTSLHSTNHFNPP